MPKHSLDDLLTLMSRLRNPKDGCPWDLKQDFSSIVPHTLEETYEVIDAINKQDWPHLKDELGDLLFQVIFYARLGDEKGHFDFADIVNNLVAKLLRRHPHVFPDGSLNSRMDLDNPLSEQQIKDNWSKIKQQEKKFASVSEEHLLDAVPASFPALIRAEKLQKKASATGFDWPDIKGAFQKFHEELDELEEAFEKHQLDAQEDELGDVLFSAVNLARFLKVKPEQALDRTNRKFIHRFNYIEKSLKAQGRSLEEASLQEMDELWEQAKSIPCE